MRQFHSVVDEVSRRGYSNGQAICLRSGWGRVGRYMVWAGKTRRYYPSRIFPVAVVVAQYSDRFIGLSVIHRQQRCVRQHLAVVYSIRGGGSGGSQDGRGFVVL